jgi:hypothetical protein
VSHRALCRRTRVYTAAFVISAAVASVGSPQPAAALNPIKPICSVAKFVSGLVGKACSVVEHGGRLIDAGGKLLGGHVGSAVKTALGGGASSIASTATTALALAAIGTWVFGGAKFVLTETAHVLAATTTPRLGSTWFSSAYWRVAAIAAMLTLPFLFAAAIQAVIRSDLTLLTRAALGYLPLSMLAVAIAAPLTMLLLAASDELASIVSSAAGHESAHFLDRTAGLIGALTTASLSPFVAFFVGLLTVVGALALWLELMVREAAVYVIVLMLPLVFAALVWPARRVWAVRSVELLVALIVSKFAIVAVLSLGATALEHSASRNIAGVLGGMVLLTLGVFTPWALLRLLPLAELASGAAGSLRGEARAAVSGPQWADARATQADDWTSRTAEMRRAAAGGDRRDPAVTAKENLDSNQLNGRVGDNAEVEAGTLSPSVPAPVDHDLGARPSFAQGPPEAVQASEPTVSSGPPAAGGVRGTEPGRALPDTTAHEADEPPLIRQFGNAQRPTLDLDLESLRDPAQARDHELSGPDQHEKAGSSEIVDSTPAPQPPERGHL